MSRAWMAVVCLEADMRDQKEFPYIVIERETGGGLGAFALGALVGVGLGLLFAPKSGAETQEDLREHARKFREAAEDRMRDVQDQLEDQLGVARDGAKEHIESVKSAMDAGVQAAREARDELEKKLETTKAAYRAGVDAASGAVSVGTDAEDALEVVD